IARRRTRTGRRRPDGGWTVARAAARVAATRSSGRGRRGPVGCPANGHRNHRDRRHAGAHVRGGSLLAAQCSGSLRQRDGGRDAAQVDPPGWSALTLVRQVQLVGKTEGTLLAGNLIAAALAGGLAAGLALLACWAALDSRSFRAGLLLLMALAWAWPGQVVG